MRWVRVAVVLAALGVVAQVANARVPAFVRQTGLTCNQCHMDVTPAPSFTFTGMKFRLNGFRTPWVAEKVEAGSEGALNGKRLVLTLGSAMSFHARSVMLQQAKPASDPALPEPAAGAPSSDIFGTLAMHYAGPIGDHVGVWDELYVYGGSSTGASSGGAGNTHGYIGLNHYAVALTTNINGNIFGLMGTGYDEGSHAFLGVIGLPQPNNQTRFGTSLAGSHAPYFFANAYAFVADRVGVLIGVQPGEDNLDWKRFDYKAKLGAFIYNTDANWLVVEGRLAAGNDFVPGVTTLQAANDGARTLVAADAVRGVSATRANGQPYASNATGDATRVSLAIGGGFTDKGPHSMAYALGQSIENETYIDGSGSKMQAIGLSLHYYYDRTYGIILGYQAYEKHNFTDAAGIVHDIPTDPALNVTLIYRMAMNFAWYFSYNDTQTQVLDQNWRNGNSWSLNWHYLW